MNVHASAYVKENCLYMTGICQTDIGAIPFNVHSKLKGEVHDQYVDVGLPDEKLDPSIAMALESATGPIMHQVQDQRMKVAAKSLVDRSRLGDQNALAILVKVRQNAEKGAPRAKRAFGILLNYAKRNTAEQSTDIGTETHGIFGALRTTLARVTPSQPEKYAAIATSFIPGSGKNTRAVVNAAGAFANGPRINHDLLNHVSMAIGDDNAKEAFAFGFENSGHRDIIMKAAKEAPPRERTALQIGYTLGLAKRIQDVREPNCPLSRFSTIVAWELGE